MSRERRHLLPHLPHTLILRLTQQALSRLLHQPLQPLEGCFQPIAPLAAFHPLALSHPSGTGSFGHSYTPSHLQPVRSSPLISPFVAFPGSTPIFPSFLVITPPYHYYPHRPRPISTQLLLHPIGSHIMCGNLNPTSENPTLAHQIFGSVS